MGLGAHLFSPQSDARHDSQSLHARINVYIKSYREAAKAVSDVIQSHTEQDKLQSWRWRDTSVGRLVRRLKTLSA